MVAAAAVTETIKIGCRVFCCDYHNPVVLAKEMATIDLMSDGRLEAGFGAGWITSEYEAIGIPMDRPGIRIARMAEYIEFSKQFFAGGQMDYHGTYVQATGFEALPVSPQPGGPKIMVGGGSPKVLGIAGKMADIVSINFDNSAGKIGEHGLASSTAERTTPEARAGSATARASVSTTSRSRSPRTSPRSPTTPRPPLPPWPRASA